MFGLGVGSDHRSSVWQTKQPDSRWLWLRRSPTGQVGEQQGAFVWSRATQWSGHQMRHEKSSAQFRVMRHCSLLLVTHGHESRRLYLRGSPHSQAKVSLPAHVDPIHSSLSCLFSQRSDEDCRSGQPNPGPKKVHQRDRVNWVQTVSQQGKYFLTNFFGNLSFIVWSELEQFWRKRRRRKRKPKKDRTIFISLTLSKTLQKSNPSPTLSCRLVCTKRDRRSFKNNWIKIPIISTSKKEPLTSFDRFVEF